MKISAWVVIGPSLRNHWLNRREAEADDEPYHGPMDDITYAILQSAADPITVQGMYETKTGQGNQPFTLFNMNFETEQEAIDAVEWLDSEWPGKQYETQGMWDRASGLQMGQSYDYGPDPEDPLDPPNIVGAPAYPLLSDTYEVMPPVNSYDDNGDLVSSTPATSNADLRDINLLSGQVPRRFT